MCCRSNRPWEKGRIWLRPVRAIACILRLTADWLTSRHPTSKRKAKRWRMNGKRIGTLACSALLFCMTAALAYGASNGEKVKINGLITGRAGEDLVVKTWGGDMVTVV